MSLELTLSKFRALCDVVAWHYHTSIMAEYFLGEDLPERFAIMRHDIDRMALDAARIEQNIRGSRK